MLSSAWMYRATGGFVFDNEPLGGSDAGSSANPLERSVAIRGQCTLLPKQLGRVLVLATAVIAPFYCPRRQCHPPAARLLVLAGGELPPHNGEGLLLIHGGKRAARCCLAHCGDGLAGGSI